MMTTLTPLHGLPENERDAGVVEEICGYLTGNPPQSFFLFAGAGSGKTRTLIEVLRRLTGREPDHLAGRAFAQRLRMRSQALRVITYTNNAVDVITGRLGRNPLVAVSTIHSFAWSLIEGFDEDIREARLAAIEGKIQEAQPAISPKKKGPSAKDLEKLASLQKRRAEVAVVERFTYSPNQQTFGAGALHHSEVLQLAAALLTKKPTLAQILRDRHPVILVDESQDTMRAMLDALRLVAGAPGGLSLGLLGDHRQRIYMDGHQDLPGAVPSTWARPVLQMNHRSAKRIVRLINRIWAAELRGRTQSGEGQEQHARSERAEGFVRIFVGDANLTTEAKVAHEKAAAESMAEITGDPAWLDPTRGYRVLTLEHKLAARRAGFIRLAQALEKADKDQVWERGDDPDAQTGGPAPLRVFMDAIAALHAAIGPDGTLDPFLAMEVVQRHGVLVSLAALHGEGQQERLRTLGGAVNEVPACFGLGRDPTLRELLQPVIAHDLFPVHHRLLEAFVDRDAPAEEDEVDSKAAERAQAWRSVLACRWSELSRYRAYLADRLGYGTHQGVKGSEFDHVQVIMDDSEAGGFLYSYDKLFGSKDLSKTDLENASEGKETTIDRTLRLLYVTCSRPKKSLALVLWSLNPRAAIDAYKKSGWFDNGDVHRIGGI